MRVRTAVLVLAACGAAPPTPPAAPPVAALPAVTAPCDPGRIGTVDVTGAARAAVPQLAVLEGTRDEPERAERIAAAATDALRARGYANAQISIARTVACGTDLHVAVALGPNYRIARIDFDTDDAFPAAERLAVLEDALGTVNTVGGAYIEYRFIRALRELKRRYREAGWLDARIAPPRATYRADGTVAIRVAMEPGPRYRIGSLKATGAGPTARARVLATLGLAPGDYYDALALRTAIERARGLLARRVDLRTSVDEDRGEIDLEAVVETRK